MTADWSVNGTLTLQLLLVSPGDGFLLVFSITARSGWNEMKVCICYALIYCHMYIYVSVRVLTHFVASELY